MIEEVIDKWLNPDGQFGENAGRLFQEHLQSYVSLSKTGTFVRSVFNFSAGVVPQDMVFDRGTVNILALEVSKLDVDKVAHVIRQALFLQSLATSRYDTRTIIFQSI